MNITDAEFKVMDAVWRAGPLSADELIAEVQSQTPWGEATVKTLINRLLKKGAIRSERIDGRHRYQAALEKEAFAMAESESLLERLFGGQVSPLVAQLASNRTLSQQDREKLKAIIATFDDE
ncbi:BlaI family transcriptional regulator [Brevundimonas intermedia]|uniref:BlaI family transcriptional regulator n=1 Tax=Brevundimonas intermedia TaxID=74315 RepID=A0ABQ5T582_9CAUL|nr:BlaI/MecI/CopY family transcriptional regulator [Brevundimonas intermedia]GLK47934.1 BlaI family transcriptional regulator [Brevundimonas intermedia]